MALPTVRLGKSNIQVTRLITGGNPLVGNSHLSLATDAAMRAYFTAEQVVAYLHACQAAGIDTIQARGDYHRILYWLELFRRAGGQLQWIAQTASEMHDVFRNIRVLAAAGACAIYHHGSRTDLWWREGRVDKVKDYLACIRDQGVQVGLGTHVPEVIEYAEEHDWDVDFYMACVYNLSRVPRESAMVAPARSYVDLEQFLDEDPPRMFATIRRTPKTCLAFKILGASRRCATQADVAAAFANAFANIKPIDAVVVGMYPEHEDQIALNVAHTLAALRP